MIFRKAKLFNAVLCLILISPLVRAETPTAAVLAPEIAQDFVRPHTLLDVGGGRKMNLYCRGEGPVTVIFDSGLSDWSSIWALVQPQTAQRTRACTYDRAGMGYSDPANRPSTPFNVVDDLRHLIKAAGIATPVVLVGHSLGGFNMKLFAASYPSEVAGLVLVDPSEERGNERVGAQVIAKFGATLNTKMNHADVTDFNKFTAQLLTCAEAARKQDLDPASALYEQCTDPVRLPLGPVIAAERQKIQVRLAYQAAQASEALSCVYSDNPQLDAQYQRIFGDGKALGNIPLIVLSHSILNPKDAYPEAAQYAWLALHEQTAASSTRGGHRIVPNTEHNIEVDDPQSIVVAINEVLDMIAVAR